MCLPIKERSCCGDNSSHGPLIKILLFVVIILSLAVTYLFIQTHQLNDALHKLQMQDASMQNGQHHNVQIQELIKTLEQSTPDIYMNFEQKREKRNGRWRNEVREEIRIMKEHISNIVNTTIPNLEAGIMKKVVHLGMSRDMTQDILHAPVNNIDVCRGGKHCLRWSNPESTYSRTFDYPRDNAYDMPVAIKVRSPGIYFVYGQVAVNGPQQGYEPSVGFEAVLVRGTVNKTLTKSYITQDDRGQVYHGAGHGEHPFDTINLMGTFKLLCDDYIVIRPIGDPKLVYTNTEASYFGVVQINPARSLLHGDYSCNPQE